MAIKISGSTIIDDSRNIVNAGVTTVGVLTGTDAKFSGTVEANEFLGTGTKLSGIVTSIVAGSNISVDQSTGQVTITGLANTANVISDTITTGTLNVTGVSTFQDNVDIAGNLAVDTNTLFVNSTTNRIGIGTDNPAYQVEIENTGANALLVLDRTDGAACFIEGQDTRSAFGSVNATPLALAYNSFAVVTIGAGGSIRVNPDGDGYTFPTTDGSADQVLQTDGEGNLSFASVFTGLGIQTAGGYIGTGVTTLDFRGSGVSTVTDPSLGFSTVFVDFNGQGALWQKNESNFTASEGQTTFTKTYQPGYLDVYLNGVRLISGDNYTATNGTSVGLTTATNAGDKVDIIAYNGNGAAELSVARTVGLVTATSGQTVFTVPSYDVGSDSLDVFVNGIKLEPTEFTETDGTTITLAVGAGAGDILQAYAYDTSGGNYWQLTGNTLHRSTYNNPVAIGTDTQNGDSYLTVGQAGAAGTSLFVYGGARITGILTVGEGSITLDGSTNQISGLSGGMAVGTGASIFSPESNTLTLGTNNSEALRIDSNGRLLVGTTNSINSSYEGGSIHLRDDGGGAILLKRNDGTDNNTVGVFEFYSSFGKSASISAENDGSHSGSSTPGAVVIKTTPSGTFDTPSERMRINRDGEVGINETDPDNKLHITTTSSSSYSTNETNTSNLTNALLKLQNLDGSDGTGANNYVGIQFSVANGATSTAQLQYVRTGDNAGKFEFKARNTSTNYPNIMTLLSSGRVGINNTSPDTKLDVNGAFFLRPTSETFPSDNGVGMRLRSDTNHFQIQALQWTPSIVYYDIDYLGLKHYWHVNGSEGMQLNGGKELLIGYTSDNGAYKLQVNSQIFATSSTIATSDGNFKENVSTLTDCLNVVDSLNPVSFDWKEQQDIVDSNDPEKVLRPKHNFPTGKQVGFIAQEVQAALSGKDYLGSIVKENRREAVVDDNGDEIAPQEDFLGLAEGSLTALLVGAIKELKAENAALRARLDNAGL